MELDFAWQQSKNYSNSSMKVARLFESANSLLLRRITLTLQAELQEDEHLGTIVDNIELHHGESRSNLYFELVTLHLTGPLFELYIDVSYDKNREWTVEARTEKDMAGDGMLLAASRRDPLNWFTTERIVKSMLDKKPIDTDMFRHNYMWFDKIARNLDEGYTFFAKNIVIDSTQIMTSQILEQDMGTTVNRFGIEFCHHQAVGYCYRLGPWNKAYRTVNDFSDINEILQEGE